jgi:hypothetical protein
MKGMEPKEILMMAGTKRIQALYVDRESRQWVAQDADGKYWIVPGEGANPWDDRRPFSPTEETDLRPVPGHYKHMLGLPA